MSITVEHKNDTVKYTWTYGGVSATLVKRPRDIIHINDLSGWSRLFDFELTEDDLEKIYSLTDGSLLKLAASKNDKFYKFVLDIMVKDKVDAAVIDVTRERDRFNSMTNNLPARYETLRRDYRYLQDELDDKDAKVPQLVDAKNDIDNMLNRVSAKILRQEFDSETVNTYDELTNRIKTVDEMGFNPDPINKERSIHKLCGRAINMTRRIRGGASNVNILSLFNGAVGTFAEYFEVLARIISEYGERVAVDFLGKTIPSTYINVDVYGDETMHFYFETDEHGRNNIVNYIPVAVYTISKLMKNFSDNQAQVALIVKDFYTFITFDPNKHPIIKEVTKEVVKPVVREVVKGGETINAPSSMMRLALFVSLLVLVVVLTYTACSQMLGKPMFESFKSNGMLYD